MTFTSRTSAADNATIWASSSHSIIDELNHTSNRTNSENGRHLEWLQHKNSVLIPYAIEGSLSILMQYINVQLQIWRIIISS